MYNIAIVDYNMGNTQSVANAFEALGSNPVISRDPEVLEAADGLVLPGVGAFPIGMRNLKNLGLIPVLDRLVLKDKKPFLGLCLGMQLIAKRGFEVEEWAGLGWIDAEVVPLAVKEQGLKVPHVGWNDVETKKDSILLGTAGELKSFYFVHSFQFVPKDLAVQVGTCEYGIDFTAVVESENIMATQFHPEKSQKNGLQLLNSFLTRCHKLEKACHA